MGKSAIRSHGAAAALLLFGSCWANACILVAPVDDVVEDESRGSGARPGRPPEPSDGGEPAGPGAGGESPAPAPEGGSDGGGECSDECSGATRCVESQEQTCGEYDDDSCTEWSDPSDCHFGCDGSNCAECGELGYACSEHSDCCGDDTFCSPTFDVNRCVEPCAFDSDCDTCCLAAYDHSNGTQFVGRGCQAAEDCSAIQGLIDAAQACGGDDQCFSGFCSAAGFCGANCTASADCGLSISGLQNGCIAGVLAPGLQPSYVCFPACESDLDCQAFPGSACIQATSIEGFEGTVCAL